MPKNQTATNRKSDAISEENFVTLPDEGINKQPPPILNGKIVIDRQRGRRAADKRDKVVVLQSPRKKRHEEPENHERWLVSYADFITLLFAFFVVMYAISSVNAGKYRALSASMGAAFHTEPRSINPIQIGEIIERPVPVIVADPHPEISAEGASGHGAASQGALDLISQEISKNLAEFIGQNLISVSRGKLWLEVDIKTSILFPSGSASLEQQAQPVLSELATILKSFPNSIHVVGFTDNRPISSVIYPSNWELSAGRAASVVHLFNNLGVQPERMAAVGYGEYRPVADNATPEGRNQNRRVVLRILANSEEAQIGVEQGTDKTN